MPEESVQRSEETDELSEEKFHELFHGLDKEEIDELLEQIDILKMNCSLRVNIKKMLLYCLKCSKDTEV